MLEYMFTSSISIPKLNIPKLIESDVGYLIESNNLYASVGWRNKIEKVGNIYKQLSTDLASSIRHFQSVANLPSRLRDTGIPRSGINDLAILASKQWTGNFNPVLLTDEVLVQLYERAY